MDNFLISDTYVNYYHPKIQELANTLFSNIIDPIKKAQIAYYYVRDEIPHTFDIQSNCIVAKASDVLKEKTGICHAKANLLAALLRSQGIPTGFCFQHLTLYDDESKGYCVHCFNAIYLDNHWIKVDARGNTNNITAMFSLNEPILAFENREDFDEYFWPGIYDSPHLDSMKMLENSTCLQDVLDTIPDTITLKPTIL